MIRQRGDAYATGRRVRLERVEAESVRASVRGSGATYDVVFERSVSASRGAKPQLLTTCSCPHFERGNLCKHIWAVVRVLDDEGWGSDWVHRDRERLRIEPASPEDAGDEEEGYELDFEDWEDDFEDREGDFELDGAFVPAEGSPDPIPRGRRGGGWRLRLPAPAVDRERPRSLFPGPAREIYFLVDPAASARARSLVVTFAVRDRKRDGSFGKLKRQSLTEQDASATADPEERRALELLLALARGLPDSQGYGVQRRRFESARLPPALHESVLPLLAETGRLGLLPRDFSYELSDVTWISAEGGPPWELTLELRRVADADHELDGRLVREGETLSILDARFVTATGFLFHGEKLRRVVGDGGVDWIARLVEGGPIRVPARDLDAFVTRLFAARLPRLDLPEGFAWSETPEAPTPRVRFDRMPGASTTSLRAHLDFRYGETWVRWNDPTPRAVARSKRIAHPRDTRCERGAVDTLRALGFAAEPQVGALTRADSGALRLVRSRFELAVRELVGKGWVVEAAARPFRAAGVSSANVSSGIDFFDLEGGIDFGGETVPFPALLAAARSGEGFVDLGDGSKGLLPRKWLERFAPLAELGEAQGERVRFGRSQAALLDALLSLQDQSRVDDAFAALRRRLARFEGVPAARERRGFRGSLREYQRTGLGWFRFLREFGFGGCLADDMGLGKTVQVLALLLERQAARRKNGDPASASLVVAPRSLVYNWLDECRRFTPQLEALDYTGPRRAALRERFAAADLVVTTYGTLRRDAPHLSEVSFDYAILDEAQAVKNPRSQAAKAARLLRADHRLALTGTPVENHLGEAASIFEFLNPGLMTASGQLRTLRSGGREIAPEALTLLSRALRPFLLRRTKEQVLPDLPPRTEQTLSCVLEGRARREYDELRRHYRVELGRRIERHGLGRTRIHVLEALLRLRQAACHPGLVAKERRDESSPKLDLLVERLEEIVSEGHKALVFSQFTQFLALARRSLDERGLSYAYLDGRTRDRKARVERFQQDPSCPLFLISLKAGGLGLNLTAADYVFILDPWWNPAVEAQAIDRAHRIGQRKPVFAYRIISRDTVEERILELQESKRELSEALVGGDKSLIQRLTAEDLEMLLSG